MQKKIWFLAVQEYRSFLLSKKTLLMLFSFIFLAEDVIGRMGKIVAETGIGLGITEPFLLILSYAVHAMVVPLMFIVLLADFPANKTSGIYVMIRSSRVAWLLGELLYAVMAGATYLLFLLAGSMLWTGKYGTFQAGWSRYMTQLYMEFPETYKDNTLFFIEAGTVTQGKPWAVLLQSLLLMLLYLLLMALILCLFKLLEKKYLGLFVAIAITGVGAVAVTFLGNVKWIFPMSHAIFGTHFREFWAKPVCPLWVSYLYFGALTAGLFLICLFLAKRFRIGDDPE